ncbi:MAG TPA: hypothetical protein VJ907_04695 [Halanaerobiales bacterium]|nr:hypothetical protein [Halanaerobiales bacterium]
MKKKQREKLLKKISDSTQGQAIREYIDVLIDNLKEEAVTDSETMDDLKGKKYAIEKMKQLKRKLSIVNKDKGRTDYK